MTFVLRLATISAVASRAAPKKQRFSKTLLDEVRIRPGVASALLGKRGLLGEHPHSRGERVCRGLLPGGKGPGDLRPCRFAAQPVAARLVVSARGTPRRSAITSRVKGLDARVAAVLPPNPALTDEEAP
jgi:hypothetical protein